mmetsp:Transcript_108243/g.316594  ORF Transcript_108243/g.316594 Transcript_108243/m.316594 type:complete len:143 (-) Transcript_108243:1372-1800(-)
MPTSPDDCLKSHLLPFAATHTAQGHEGITSRLTHVFICILQQPGNTLHSMAITCINDTTQALKCCAPDASLAITKERHKNRLDLHTLSSSSFDDAVYRCIPHTFFLIVQQLAQGCNHSNIISCSNGGQRGCRLTTHIPIVVM